MKLYSFDLFLAMTEAHDHTVACLGRDLQTCRQAFTFDNQRMIATGFERRVEILKDRLAVMCDFRRLAVHNRGCPHDPPAESFANGLMAQANSQDRNAAGEMRDQGERYACLGRAA